MDFVVIREQLGSMETEDQRKIGQPGSSHQAPRPKRNTVGCCLYSPLPQSTKKSLLINAARSHRTVCWPAEVLSQDMAQARIWTYGYNADVISGIFRANNKNSILQHANDFVVKLERTLDDSVGEVFVGLEIDTDGKKQPIIFVTHSLGGIVVKRVRVSTPL
jgi:hypothetical protein